MVDGSSGIEGGQGKIVDARTLDFTLLIGYLSSSSQLPASLHVRDRLLNLFLHPSIYPGSGVAGDGDAQLDLPLTGRAGWTLLTAHDARARVFAFGNIPSHLFSSESSTTDDDCLPAGNQGKSEQSCWGLVFIISPINSLVTPPKKDEDPPILDLWTSRPCQPERANDDATALIANIFSGFVQTELTKWYSTTSKPDARLCFGYSIPSDIVSVLYQLAEKGKLTFKVQWDYRGQTMLLPSHTCWPEPPPPLQGFPNLFLDRVRPCDVEQIWDGANRNYSQEYVASRMNISYCLRERRDDLKVEPSSAQTLAEDDEHQLADWRGPKLVASPSYTRVSDFIIKHVSHQIVAAKLYALWACGLSSTKESWNPTPVANADILDPLVKGRDPASDILAVCSEVAVDNADGDRLFGRLGFDTLGTSRKLEVSWLTFSMGRICVQS